MGITKTLIRINLRERPDLRGAILKANAYLAHNNAAELFATLVYAAFDPRSGEIEFASCGHPPALLRRADGVVETLQDGGMPVGLFDNLKMSVNRAELREGDLFFLYSDGVTEASDINEIEFGERRLLDLLRQDADATANQWVARVEYAVRDFAHGKPQFDDITCLALKR